MLLYRILPFTIHYTWKNIKKSFKNNKFKISAETRNEEFELPNGSQSVSDIRDYFEYIIKQHGTVTDNLSIRIYVNKTFRIESRLKLKEGIILNY